MTTDDTPDLARAVEAVLPDECWVFNSTEITCRDIGTIGANNAEWTPDMCCVPCRVRAILAAHRPDRATQPTEAVLTDGALPCWRGCPTHIRENERRHQYPCEHSGIVEKLPARTQPTTEPHCPHGSTLTELCEAFQIAPNDPHPEPRTVETDERGGER